MDFRIRIISTVVVNTNTVIKTGFVCNDYCYFSTIVVVVVFGEFAWLVLFSGAGGFTFVELFVCCMPILCILFLLSSSPSHSSFV